MWHLNKQPKPDRNLTELTEAIERLCDQAVKYSNRKRFGVKLPEGASFTLEQAALEYAETVRAVVEREKRK